MLISLVHPIPLSQRNIPATIRYSRSSTLFAATQTFSSAHWPSSTLSSQSLHSRHISAESPSPYEYGQFGYCTGLSRNQASVSAPSEKVCPGILLCQDSGFGVDISVSTQYDSGFGIRRVRKNDCACSHSTISTPQLFTHGHARGTQSSS